MSASGQRISKESSTVDREIFATRVLGGRRDLAWKLWTEPSHISNWWGPKGLTITTSEMDVKPGGVWKHVMHRPDGKDYPN